MKILKSIILIVFLSCPLIASTWYISPSGNDTTGNGTTGTPWLTLNKAFTSMAGGDTLIIKDGTYTGTNNTINITTQLPPTGSSGAYTIIKAEHDGLAIFDGQGVNNMFKHDGGHDYGKYYWQFEGLVWCNGLSSNILINACGYVKFLRCGAYDAGIGETSNFNTGTNAYSILFENCYAYGSGRYKFILFNSSNCIVRNCVARSDRTSTWSGAHYEPIGGFIAYGSPNALFQNNIHIDSDQDKMYDYSELIGSFGNPVSGSAQYMTSSKFENCIAINNHIAGGAVDVGYTSAYYNCAWYDLTNMGTGNNLFNLRGTSVTYQNCTFGSASNYANAGAVDFYDATEGTIKNCILYHFVGTAGALGKSYTTLFNDYNSFFDNTLNYDGATPGAHDITNNSPIWSVSNSSGGLKYLPRIESGSSLDGAGQSGADIGANITTLIGSTGTLWGEAGYNTDTGISMWPFPNEDLIKEKMNAYSYTDATGTVSGNRGFASTSTTSMDGSPMTLTKYIWEYLGNQIPADIYPVVSTVTATASAAPTSGDTPLEVTFSGSAITSSGTITGYAWSFSDGQTSSLQNPTMTFTQSVVATLTATDSNGSVDSDTVSVIVNVPLAPYTVTIQGSFNTTGSYTLH